MDRFATKMKARGLSDAAIDAFRSNYDQLITGNDGLVPESSIEGVTTLPSLESVAAPAGPDDLKELLAKTAGSDEGLSSFPHPPVLVRMGNPYMEKKWP